MEDTKIDRDFVRLSLDYSLRALGTTAQNPHVACIIVKEQKILAAEYTQKGGRPHAEIKALQKINFNAKDATIYVSLEPCCKKNSQTSCVDAIIKAKPKKVVYPINDPNPNINGNSCQMLENAGIKVITGIENKRAKRHYAGFFSRMTKYRPTIILKIALSKDKKIAKKLLKTKITNHKTDRITHLLRAYCDAILIGKGTLKIDNPRLNCRIKGLEKLSPIKYVIDTNIEIKPEQNIFEELYGEKVNLFVAENFFEKLPKKQIEKYQTKIRFIPVEYQKNSKHLKIERIIEQFYHDKINHLLIEGGQKLSSQMLKANLVDELHIVRTEKIIGENALEPINYDCIDNVIENDFKKVSQRNFYDDKYQIYLNKTIDRDKSCLPV